MVTRYVQTILACVFYYKINTLHVIHSPVTSQGQSTSQIMFRNKRLTKRILVTQHGKWCPGGGYLSFSRVENHYWILILEPEICLFEITSRTLL